MPECFRIGFCMPCSVMSQSQIGIMLFTLKSN